MKVFIVNVRQGRWDDVTTWTAGVFVSKALANHYIHKLQCTFKKCYDFYKPKYDEYDEWYDNLSEINKTEETASKWCRLRDRIEKFDTPNCWIVEKELQGIKKDI